MKVAITCFSLLLIGAFGIAQQPAQPLLQNKPASLTSASVSALQQRAAAGDAQAQFELGRAYEDGSSVAQDDSQAAEWFHKSAEQGNAQAQNSLGVMYAQGRGVNRDREEAFRWYKQAAKTGLAEATYNVAISYYNGEGIDANLNYATTWMMAASRKGDAQATEALTHLSQELNNRIGISKFQLAQLYEKGDEVPQDLTTAISLYTELGGEKDYSCCAADSRYKLCQFYFNGTGVTQDYARARPWCEKSHEAFSYEMLGRMAEQGLGQQKDLRQATGYYKTAALHGVTEGYMDAARLEMASRSHDGEKRAYFWYYLAADLEIANAKEKLREIAALLPEKEITKQQKQAAEWQKMQDWERFKNLKKH